MHLNAIIPYICQIFQYLENILTIYLGYLRACKTFWKFNIKLQGCEKVREGAGRLAEDVVFEVEAEAGLCANM